MPRARRARLSLALTGLLSTACDDASEVDRGAKPIEAHRSEAGPTDLAAIPLELDDLELDAVHVVATGTLGDTPLAMIAAGDRTIVCAAIRVRGGMRWLDVDALADGELVLLDHRPSDLDPAAAELLQQLVDRLPEAEPASSAVDELAQPTDDPTPVQCPPPVGDAPKGGGPQC